jgi:hypothetical protein
VNASTVDTLALAELLSPEQIVRQGLHRRVELAREVASDAITKAEVAFKPLAITRQQIRTLVDDHIKEASQNLSRARLVTKILAGLMSRGMFATALPHDREIWHSTLRVCPELGRNTPISVGLFSVSVSLGLFQNKNQLSVVRTT